MNEAPGPAARPKRRALEVAIRTIHKQYKDPFKTKLYGFDLFGDNRRTVEIQSDPSDTDFDYQENNSRRLNLSTPANQANPGQLNPVKHIPVGRLVTRIVAEKDGTNSKTLKRSRSGARPSTPVLKQAIEKDPSLDTRAESISGNNHGLEWQSNLAGDRTPVIPEVSSAKWQLATALPVENNIGGLSSDESYVVRRDYRKKHREVLDYSSSSPSSSSRSLSSASRSSDDPIGISDDDLQSSVKLKRFVSIKPRDISSVPRKRLETRKIIRQSVSETVRLKRERKRLAKSLAGKFDSLNAPLTRAHDGSLLEFIKKSNRKLNFKRQARPKCIHFGQHEPVDEASKIVDRLIDDFNYIADANRKLTRNVVPHSFHNRTLANRGLRVLHAVGKIRRSRQPINQKSVLKPSDNSDQPTTLESNRGPIFLGYRPSNRRQVMIIPKVHRNPRPACSKNSNQPKITDNNPNTPENDSNLKNKSRLLKKHPVRRECLLYSSEVKRPNPPYTSSVLSIADSFKFFPDRPVWTYHTNSNQGEHAAIFRGIIVRVDASHVSSTVDELFDVISQTIFANLDGDAVEYVAVKQIQVFLDSYLFMIGHRSAKTILHHTIGRLKGIMGEESQYANGYLMILFRWALNYCMLLSDGAIDSFQTFLECFCSESAEILSEHHPYSLSIPGRPTKSLPLTDAIGCVWKWFLDPNTIMGHDRIIIFKKSFVEAFRKSSPPKREKMWGLLFALIKSFEIPSMWDLVTQLISVSKSITAIENYDRKYVTACLIRIYNLTDIWWPLDPSTDLLLSCFELVKYFDINSPDCGGISLKALYQHDSNQWESAESPPVLAFAKLMEKLFNSWFPNALFAPFGAPVPSGFLPIKQQEVLLKKWISKIFARQLPSQPLRFTVKVDLKANKINESHTSVDCWTVNFLLDILFIFEFLAKSVHESQFASFSAYLDRIIDYELSSSPKVRLLYMESLLRLWEIQSKRNLNAEKIAESIKVHMKKVLDLFSSAEKFRDRPVLPVMFLKSFDKSELDLDFFIPEFVSRFNGFPSVEIKAGWETQQREYQQLVVKMFQWIREASNPNHSDELLLLFGSEWIGPISPVQSFPAEVRIEAIKSIRAIIRFLFRPAYATRQIGVVNLNLEPTEFDQFLVEEGVEIDSIPPLMLELEDKQAKASKAVLTDLEYATRLLSDLIQSRFHLGSRAIDDQLFHESVNLSAEIGCILIKYNRRSFQAIYETFGPETFWAIAGKYRFHTDNRIRMLIFLVSLLEILPSAIDHAQESILKVWFQSALDPLILLQSVHWRTFNDLFLRLSNSLIEGGRVSDLFNNVSIIDLASHDVNFNFIRSSVLAKVLQNMQVIMNDAFETRDIDIIRRKRCLFNACLLPLPTFMKHCLEKCTPSEIPAYVHECYNFVGMMMNYCTLLIYQENEARPLILELEREFISKDFGSDSKIEEMENFKEELLISFFRGLSSLNYEKDHVIRKILMSKLKSCMNSFRSGGRIWLSLVESMDPLKIEHHTVREISFDPRIAEFRSFFVRHVVRGFFEAEISSSNCEYSIFGMNLLRIILRKFLINHGIHEAKRKNIRWFLGDIMSHVSGPMIWWIHGLIGTTDNLVCPKSLKALQQAFSLITNLQAFTIDFKRMQDIEISEWNETFGLLANAAFVQSVKIVWFYLVMLDRNQASDGNDHQESSNITPELQDVFQSIIGKDLRLVQELEEHLEMARRKMEFCIENHIENWQHNGINTAELMDDNQNLCVVNNSKDEILSVSKSVAAVLKSIFIFWRGLYLANYHVRAEILNMIHALNGFLDYRFEQSILVRLIRMHILPLCMGPNMKLMVEQVVV